MNTVIAPAPVETDLGSARTPRFPLIENNFSLVSNFLIALSQSASGESAGEPRAFWPAGGIRQLLIGCTSLGGPEQNSRAEQLGEQVRKEISTSTGVSGQGPGQRDLDREKTLREGVDLLIAAARAGKPAMATVDQVVDLILPSVPRGVHLLTGRAIETI